MTYLVSKLTFFFFQNLLQAKITNNNYKDPDNLMFTDIIILGMDKQPTNLTVLVNNAFASIANVDYSASTKVGNRSSCHPAGPSPRAPAWDSGRSLVLALLSLGGHRGDWHAGKLPYRREKRECVNMDPCSLFHSDSEEDRQFFQGDPVGRQFFSGQI